MPEPADGARPNPFKKGSPRCNARAQQITPPAGEVMAYVNPKSEPRKLVKATPADLKFLDSLQKKFARSLGFLPAQALMANIEQGNVTLTNENDDAAGYILARPRLAWQPGLTSIVQAAVCMDAQRRQHGLALLLTIEQAARERGQIALQANCAIGVEANEFWQAAGFKPIAHMTPHTKSGRHIICWRKPLTRKLPAWFAELPKRAGHRAANAISVREQDRSPEDQEFATRFLAARQMAEGNPELPENGLIRSTTAAGRNLIGEE